MEKLKLAWLWEIRLRFYAEGNKLWAKGGKLLTEGDKLRAEGDKLWAKGGKLLTEGDKLRAEGGKLRAKGSKLWAEGILAVYGNVTMKWKSDYECVVDGKDVYRARGGKEAR